MEVYVLEYDSQHNRLSTIDILDSYNSFIWTERYAEAGDFQLDLPASEYHVDLLRQDRYLKIADSNETMIIENISIKTENRAKHMTVTGRSLISILDRRVVLGTRYFNDAEQSEDPDLNLNLWEIAYTLVNENVVDPAHYDLQYADPHLLGYNNVMAVRTSKRQISCIYLPTTDVQAHTSYYDNNKKLDPDGKIISKKPIKLQFNGETIYDAIKSLCDKYHIGFAISDYSKLTNIQTNKPFAFYLYDGRDLSNSVILSPTFDNIANISYTSNKNGYKNVMLAIGDELNYDPVNYQAWAIVDTKGHVVNNNTEQSLIDDIPGGLELRESINDLSSTITHDGDSASGQPLDLDDEQYYRVLTTRAYEVLKDQNTALEAFDGELVSGDKMYQVKRDYDLGDIVRMSDNMGHDRLMRVTEIIYSHNVSGYKIYPTLALYEKDEYQQRDEI